MSFRPYLQPWWRVTYEAARVSFHYGAEFFTIEGGVAATLLPRLIPLLDGTHTVESIVTQLGPQTASAVAHFVGGLHARGMLLTGDSLAVPAGGATREAVHFIAATRPSGEPPAADMRRLLALRVGVVGAAAAGREAAAALRGMGAQVRRLEWESADADLADCAIVLVVPAPVELPQLDEWNRFALQARKPWLAVLPYDGTFAAVGPLYVPGETACFECYQQRRAARVGSGAAWWAMQATPAAYPSPPALEMTLAGLAVLALLRWHLRRDPQIAGTFLALEAGAAIGLTSHVVYRVPRCAACAVVAGDPPGGAWLEAVPCGV